MTAAPGDDARRDPSDDPVALRSPRHLRFFLFAFGRFFGRHMRALRVARWGRPEVPAGRPLVVFSNHPSWWDGVLFMLLGLRLFPARAGFVPMDAAALGRYGFMRRIGVFGIEQHSARGAARFLRTARRVLEAPHHMLWITAPGRFSDARERPVPVAPGLARLSEAAPEAVFLPLALEYVFWTERAPEALAAFGPAIPAAELNALDRDARAERLRLALEAVMDRLATDSISRDAERFEALHAGREGMGGLYGGWQRLRAALRGERYDPRHDSRPPRDA